MSGGGGRPASAACTENSNSYVCLIVICSGSVLLLSETKTEHCPQPDCSGPKKENKCATPLVERINLALQQDIVTSWLTVAPSAECKSSVDISDRRTTESFNRSLKALSLCVEQVTRLIVWQPWLGSSVKLVIPWQSDKCPWNRLVIAVECTDTFSCVVYSLCTTLCVEWEPDLIAISLLYLSCRLTKFKVSSWVDKPDGYTGKWYTFFVNDVSLDIIDCKSLADFLLIPRQAVSCS